MRRLPLLLLVACQSAPPVCEEAECQPLCDDNPDADRPAVDPDDRTREIRLSDAEWVMLGPDIDDLRQGVRPTGPDSVGVCGGNNCEELKGIDAGLLPPGRWRLRAELTVPRAGGKAWEVTFRQTCEITRLVAGDPQVTTDQQIKTFDVRYESPMRGTVLDGIVPIVSPDPEWHRLCAWFLDLPGPQGRRRLEGSYEVPRIDELEPAPSTTLEPPPPDPATPPPDAVPPPLPTGPPPPRPAPPPGEPAPQ